MKMHPTKNDLPERTRTEVAELLDARLADGIDLALQAKQAHWNVKGPTFLQLHELFDRVHDSAREWNDMLAERAVQLGGTVDGRIAAVQQRTTLPAYAPRDGTGRAHVDALSGSLAAFGERIRAAIASAEGAGDAGTADLFTEISRGSDEMLWFLEAHLQGEGRR